jgi:vacuolar-type H+-ATPase subunit I/STV1
MQCSQGTARVTGTSSLHGPFIHQFLCLGFAGKAMFFLETLLQVTDLVHPSSRGNPGLTLLPQVLLLRLTPLLGLMHLLTGLVRSPPQLVRPGHGTLQLRHGQAGALRLLIAAGVALVGLHHSAQFPPVVGLLLLAFLRMHLRLRPKAFARLGLSPRLGHTPQGQGLPQGPQL